MGFEKELERVLSRRKFLAGLGLTVGSVSLAKLALLQTKAEELARRNNSGVSTGPGSGPLDPLSLANAQEFRDAYVQKNPTVQQVIHGSATLPRSLRIDAGAEIGYIEFEAGTVPTVHHGVEDLEGGTTPPIFINIVDILTGIDYPVFRYRPITKDIIVGNYGDGAVPKVLTFQASSSTVDGSNFGFNAESEQGLGSLSTLIGPGAQVGQPTATSGSMPNTLCFGGHRHAFSGRFSKSGYVRDASLGGAAPAKFARIISNNNWTLRRISVYALTAPVTGSDTYGVVNAAGTLQGTAVSLASGVQENATALQVTNLTGGTVYYIAVTARATTPALDVNVEVEYTMNV